MSVEIRTSAFQHRRLIADLRVPRRQFSFYRRSGLGRRAAALIFSDIPANTIYQWSRTKGVEEFRKPSNKSNGLTWDCEGRLLR